jgi:hypothetical protein
LQTLRNTHSSRASRCSDPGASASTHKHSLSCFSRCPSPELRNEATRLRSLPGLILRWGIIIAAATSPCLPSTALSGPFSPLGCREVLKSTTIAPHRPISHSAWTCSSCPSQPLITTPRAEGRTSAPGGQGGSTCSTAAALRALSFGADSSAISLAALCYNPCLCSQGRPRGWTGSRRRD